MKTSNRWLMFFGIGIAVLVVVTVILVLALPAKVDLLPENTPEGVVQRFLMAVQDGDLTRAFGYMDVVEQGKTVTYADWSQFLSPPRGDQNPWKATLGETRTNAGKATVEVVVDVFRPGGPFENPVDSFTVAYELTLKEGVWLITTRPPLWFVY